MLKLEDLRKETGVFISEADFQVILLDYKTFINEMELEDSNESEQKYIQYWIKEQEVFGTILETADSKIKYYCPDASDDNDNLITTMELLNRMDDTSFRWETKCRGHWKMFHDILRNKNVEELVVLIKEALAKETISYDQMYELQSLIKNRVFELLNGMSA